MNEDFLFRFETRVCSAGIDEFDKSLGTTVEVYLLKFKVLRETPKGCWIERPFDKPRFVLNDSRKKFACRTPADARTSFDARNAAYIRILRAKIRNAETAKWRVDQYCRNKGISK